MVLQIAKKYGVSKRTIQFILDPKKLEDNRILAKERKKIKNKFIRIRLVDLFALLCIEFKTQSK
jgi:hypothetical protein